MPKTSLNEFENVSLWLGDTLNYFGSNIPKASAENYILIRVDADTNNNRIINSEDADIWTHYQISIINNAKYSSGTFSLVFDKDTSWARIVNFINHPLLDSTQISSATFSMGYEFGELDEQPVHDVALTNDLIVTKYEISQKIYSLVMGANPSTVIGLDLPVHNITWEDAALFCNNLSDQYGLSPVYELGGLSSTINLNSPGWRLPSEAEWEYMAGGGESHQFLSYSDLSEGAWYNANSGYVVHSVGIKKENSLGLFDMLGNVAEYCSDSYISDFYSATYSATFSNTFSGTFTAQVIANNPIAHTGGDSHVIRGGSCVQSDRYCRLTARSSTLKQKDFVGFRIVRTVVK